MFARKLRFSIALVAISVPFTMGARGDGCSSNSRSPAPNVEGTWAIEYDDVLDVTIKIGGATYTEQLGPQGGVINITHEGTPLSFDLDCDRPEILCPSEAWPATIEAEQRNDTFEHRMIITLPTQSCSGNLLEPDDAECGIGTLNEDCDMVCDGTMIVREVERFGVIGESGDTFRLYLGAGVATNGINCALLAASIADAELGTSGNADDGNWEAETMDAGLVTIGYAGGCLWAGDPDMDGELEAIVIGASITFRTGFTGVRL